MLKARSVLALAVLALAGCAPADDNDHLVFVVEAEPNENPGEATALGPSGVYAFRGTCGGGIDYYEATTAAGVIEATLSVSTEQPGGPVEFAVSPAKLRLLSATLAVLAEDADVTPEEPAEVTGPATAAGAIYLVVDCPEGEALYYSGMLIVP